MELQYQNSYPENTMIMSSTFNEHSRTTIKSWPSNGHRMITYPPPVAEKWSKASTGGLTGINSPFSIEPNTETMIPSLQRQHKEHHTCSFRNEKYRTKMTNFQRTIYDHGYTNVSGQPTSIIKKGYYKEFVEESLLRKNSGKSRQQHTLEVENNANPSRLNDKVTVHHNQTTEDAQPALKKLRSDTSSRSAFTVFDRKGNYAYSRLKQRLKSLPPPPPLVKVKKVREYECDPQDISQVPHDKFASPKPQYASKGGKHDSSLNITSSRGTLRRDFDEVKITLVDRGSENTMKPNNLLISDNKGRATESEQKPKKVRGAIRHCSSVEEARFSPRSQETLTVSKDRDSRGTSRASPYLQINTSQSVTRRTSETEDSRSLPPLNQNRAGGTPRPMEVPSPNFQDKSNHREIRCSPGSNIYRNTPSTWDYDGISSSLKGIKETMGREEKCTVLIAKDMHKTTRSQSILHQGLRNNNYNNIFIIDDPPTLYQSRDIISQRPRSRATYRSYSYGSNQTSNHLYSQIQRKGKMDGDIKPYTRCHCQCKTSSEGYLAGIPHHACSSSLKSWTSSSSSSSSSSSPSSSSSKAALPSSTSVVMPMNSYNSRNKKLQRSYSAHDAYTVHSSQTNNQSFAQKGTYVINNVSELQNGVKNDSAQVSPQTFKHLTMSRPQSIHSVSKKPSLVSNENPLKVLSDTTQRIKPILPKPISTPVKTDEIRYDRNKNELFSTSPLTRQMTISQEYQISTRDSQNKIPPKRAYSDGDVQNNECLTKEMLLQLPIEDDKDESKGYGGYAYDHDSLPIIVAVHSVSVRDKETETNNDSMEKSMKTKDFDSHLAKPVSIEVPHEFITISESNGEEIGSPDESTASIENNVNYSGAEAKESTVQNMVKQETSKTNEERQTCITTTQNIKVTSTQAPTCEVQPYINSDLDRTNRNFIALAPKPQKVDEKLENKPQNVVQEHKALVKPTKTDGDFEKSSKKEVSVEKLSKKVLETRKRIKEENIDWKKRLLCKLEAVLTKRLRKAEKITGVKSTIQFPASKEKNKAVSKTGAENNDEHEVITTERGLKDIATNGRIVTKKIVKKNHRKLKKLMVTPSNDDDQLSDYELTIEETQESHEEETNIEETNLI